MLNIFASKLSSDNRGFLFLLLLLLGCLNLSVVQAQEATDNNVDMNNTTEVEPPPQEQIRPGMVLSLQGAEKMLGEANQAIASQNYNLAIEKLQGARQLFNQLSNFYLQLSQNFSGINAQIADESRNKAFQSGQKRDETTYQLALVHRAQNQPELAVPLLLQVIRSQNPTSELGRKAYQQLYEIGFINTPFSR